MILARLFDGVSALLLIINALAIVELWQRKEYRWDRLKSYLKSPEARQRQRPWYHVADGLVAGAWLSSLWDLPLLTHVLAVTALLAVIMYHNREWQARGFFRPKPTVKAGTLLVGLLGVSAVLFQIGNDMARSLNWALIIVTLPLVSVPLAGIINFLFWYPKRRIIRRAVSKRQQLATLTVVGITGSYGKTSTKFFLHHLLGATESTVLATPTHVNTEIGVAMDMVRRLTAETKTYIVEMGAYRRGEIAALCYLARPQIGVLTFIGNQHLDLFGSVEAIAAAKWELIDALPPHGVAILNADDPRQQRAAKSYDGKIIWYSLRAPADIYTTRLALRPTNATLELRVKDHSATVTVPVVSEGLLASLVAAVAAADTRGVPFAKIVERLTTLTPLPRTMEIKPHASGAVIIDDSYSANEAGVINALQHLVRFSQTDKRIIITPLIELGAESPAVHRRLGEELATSNAHIFIVGNAYSEEIRSGVHSRNSAAQLSVYTDPLKLTAVATQNMTANTVILLEGRIPDVVRQTFVS
jgi:UDP-N-acetylmuramoyl-tripeptide--D-alanyl-D-alanine ligase